MPHNRTSVAIDFGTSNTVMAVADPDGEVTTIKFQHGDNVLDLYMSALCFWEERKDGAMQMRLEGGPWAVDQFLEGIGPHRFLQSFKTFAASKAFQETWIFRRKFAFEDLLAAFLRTLFRHADTALDVPDFPIVVGRPVRFAGFSPDESLAMRRYGAGFEKVGVSKVHYVYEPTGAAFFFAQRLAADATVLIADFGGGTSDFSVMRFSRTGRVSATGGVSGTGGVSPSAPGLRAEPLGNAGIGIAGDAFDYRIIDRVVSPKLGKGGDYRSFGKLLTIPNGYFSNFARWNQLAMMKSSGELKELIQLSRFAVDPGPLEKFIEIVEGDMGFALYRAVSAAKVALSSHERAEFEFRSGNVAISETIAREDFERWIEEDVNRIAATVDKALKDANVTERDIDRVFLTGGTSFIPAIRRIFSDRFGDDRLETGDQFESIARGLALIGQSDDVAQWSVAG